MATATSWRLGEQVYQIESGAKVDKKALYGYARNTKARVPAFRSKACLTAIPAPSSGREHPPASSLPAGRQWPQSPVESPVKRAKALRLFKHTFQIVHIDGLTFDFLFGLAKDLAEKQELALLGAGFKGSLPLIVRDRGSLKTRLII